MSPDQIKQLVQQEVQIQMSGSRFGLTTIPRHTHNNIDSPNVFSPTLTYAGEVLAGDYGVTSPTPILLPKGWTVGYVTTGSLAGAYQVTHNLGTSQYAVVVSASPGNPAVLNQVFVNVEENPANFLVIFANSSTFPIDCGFTFTLTQINNRKANLPTYVSSVS